MAEQAWAVAEREVALAFGGEALHELAPPVEVPRLDARGYRRREAVAERDRGIEPIRDESPALHDGDGHEGRGLLRTRGGAGGA